MEPIKIILNNFQDLLRGLIAQLPQIGLGLLVLLLTWFLVWLASKVTARLLRSERMRRSRVELFQRLIAIIVWLAGIIIAVTIVFPSITPAKLLAAIGLSSIAVGFAFKDIFENFLAGILILLREPFELGDYIDCADYEGFVEQITIRDTHLRKTDGRRAVMPNATLFKNPVLVHTDQPLRRITVICGVAYGENVDESRSVIEAAVKTVPTVAQDKPIEIFAQTFNSSSIDFEVTWWTGSKPLEIRQSRDQVVAAVKHGLDDAGIEIPFPYRTLTFKEPLPIKGQAAAQTQDE